MSLVIGYYLKLSIYPDWMEKIVSSALMTGTLVIIGALIVPHARMVVAWSLAALCIVGSLVALRYEYVMPVATDPIWLVTCCIVASVLGSVGAVFVARELINMSRHPELRLKFFD